MTSDDQYPLDPQPVIVNPRQAELIDHRYDTAPPPYPRPVGPGPAQMSRYKKRALLLFLATCVSVFLAGMTPGGGLAGFLTIANLLVHGKPVPLEALVYFVQNGLIYAGAVLAILGSHEMGHYLQAKRYHVPATPPFFIPFPISPFGTMGAVIIQGAGVANRKAMFDIAISGPLAGLVLALPITWFGLKHAVIGPVPPNNPGIEFGEPLIFTWMFEWIRGPKPAGFEIMLNPLLFAGWVGIFITALNLIPIGQLDGGHILYTLVGRRAHVVATSLLMLAVVYMIYTANYSYSLMVFLLLMMGPRHPPTADDAVPLGWFRHVLGWLTLGFIIIGFTPTPIA